MALRLLLVATFACSLAAGVASADTPDRAGAEAVFRQGRTSADAGDYARACTAFTESLRLEPTPGALLNLADCEEHVGRLATARDYFLRVESVLPAEDERRGIARERAASLGPRVPWLVVTLAPGAPRDARVFRDDVELDASRLGVPLPVDPGPHGVLVVAAGRESVSTAVLVAEGSTVRLVVAPGTVLPSQDVARVMPPSSRTHTAGWLVGAAGIASLGVATYFGARALAERSLSDVSCAGGVCGSAMGLRAYQSARSDAVAADVALGVGIAALAVGGILLLTSGGSPPSATGLRLTGPGLGAAW